jgi:hypothetical protein
MFSEITNIYNKEIKGPTLMELNQLRMVSGHSVFNTVFLYFLQKQNSGSTVHYVLAVPFWWMCTGHTHTIL